MNRTPRELRIAFVCRGGTSVGMGHIMRTAAIAGELRRINQATSHVILIGDESLGRAFFNGNTDWSAADSDAEAAAVVERFEPHAVVFDTIDMDAGRLRGIRKGRVLVGLSPVCAFMDQLDLVFSRAPLMPAQSAGDVRAGPQYATIGPHCRRVSTSDYRRNLALEPLAVAISMGGADAANKTLRILEAIRDVPCSLLIWALLGEGYLHSYQALVDCVSADRRHEIILAKTRDSMWRIMGGCCVAILGGGITAYESVYAGIPAILTLDDDRDHFLVEQLVGRGACRYAGAPLGASLAGIVHELTELNERREELLAMHRASRTLLDGRGAGRIAEELLAFCRLRLQTGAALCASA